MSRSFMTSEEQREYLAQMLPVVSSMPEMFSVLLDSTTMDVPVDGPDGQVRIPRRFPEPVAEMLIHEFGSVLTDEQWFEAFSHTQRLNLEGTALSRLKTTRDTISDERLQILKDRHVEVLLRVHTFADLDRKMGLWLHGAGSASVPADFPVVVARLKQECMKVGSPRPLLDYLASVSSTVASSTEHSDMDFCRQAESIAKLWSDDPSVSHGVNLRDLYVREVDEELALRESLRAQGLDPHDPKVRLKVRPRNAVGAHEISSND